MSSIPGTPDRFAGMRNRVIDPVVDGGELESPF